MAFIDILREAFILFNSSSEEDKLKGLLSFQKCIESQDISYERLGYDRVLFKELLRSCLIENDNKVIREVLKILKTHFFHLDYTYDESVKTILERAAKSTKEDDVVMYLEILLELIRKDTRKILKHTSQILLLIDTDLNIGCNEIYMNILKELQLKLPQVISCSD